MNHSYNMNLIDTLKPEEKSYLHYKELKKDYILFREDDYCDSIGILIEGQLSIVTDLIDGQSIVYNNITPYGVFGNNLIFSSNPYYRGDIIAVENSKVVLIYRNDLINILKNNEKFLLMYMEIQSNFGKQLNARIKMLSINSMSERFLYLLHLNKGTIKYNSITGLARQLNMERETLSRLISKMIKDNIIVKEDKTIRIIK